MALQRRDASQVVTWAQGMTRPRWLGQTGHVTALKYSWTCPGGADHLSCNLMVEANTRTEATDVGRIVQVFRGGGLIWEGTMNEPVPTTSTGWTLSAVGAGNYGTNYDAIYTSTWPANQPDESVNNAIGRGLRWVNQSGGLAGTGTGWSFAPAGTPLAANYFITSTSQAASIDARQQFTDTLNPGITFTVTQIGPPSGGFNNIFFTPPATVLMDATDTVTAPATPLWLGQAVDSGAQTITDLLNLNCTYGGLTWFVDTGPAGNSLSMFPLPTAVNRLLLARQPVPRTLGGDINVINLRYQSSADSTSGTSVPAVFSLTSATVPASIALHGRREAYLDLSSAGTLSAGAAQAVGNAILQRYQRASFAGPFAAGPGDLMTTSGQAMDLGLNHAGAVAQLLLTDYGYGGEVVLGPVSFLIGAYEYDDDTLTGTVTPFQSLNTSFTGLLSAASTTLPKPSAITVPAA